MNNTDCFKLFVYGSLLKNFGSPAHEMISHYFDFVSEAKINGKVYDLGEYPAAKPSDDGSLITGELYILRNADAFEFAMAQLDDYEGVEATDDEPALYYRNLTPIFLPNGETDTAWVYWYHGNVNGKPVVESGNVLEYQRLKNLLQ